MNPSPPPIRWNEKRLTALRRNTARNQLRFVETEILVGRMSATVASRDADRRDYSAAERRIAIAKHAHESAARFVGRVDIDPSTGERLGQALAELGQAIQSVSRKTATLRQADRQ